MKLIVSLAVLWLGAFQTLIAQDIPDITTDRPDATESSSVLPVGALQFESGAEYEQTNDSALSIAHPTALLRYGVSKNFELRLATEFVTERTQVESNAGLQPIELGFKAQLTRERGVVPEIAVLTHFALSHVASKVFRVRYVAPKIRFSFGHSLSDKIGLGYNLGAEWDGESAEPSFIYTLSTSFDLTERLGTYIEAFGFVPQYTEQDHRANGGFTYRIGNNFQLDAMGGIGLSDAAPDYFIGSGLSFRIL